MFLGSNLQYLRKTNGNMTQERLAERLGVSRQTVSKWESGEAYPEMPKLLDLCDFFRCKLDELLRQDMNGRANSYYPVRIVRVEGFRMAHYVMISPNAEDDVKTYMDTWAANSGLLDNTAHRAVRISWGFPYVSSEQKNRFGLRGCACGYILPENFQPSCGGPEITRQETADYAVITIREPYSPSDHKVSHGYHMIMDYLSTNGIKKSIKSGSLPCFEYVYEQNGIPFMDIYVHCESVSTVEIIKRFI